MEKEEEKKETLQAFLKTLHEIKTALASKYQTLLLVIVFFVFLCICLFV